MPYYMRKNRNESLVAVAASTSLLTLNCIEMSLSKPRYMPSYDFPELVLPEIFKRLPVKYVLRCMCVQKSWYYLIKSPMFVTLHYNYQKLTAHDNPKYLLFHNTNTHEFTVCSDDNVCQKYCTLKYPIDFDNHEWAVVSNGLICISTLSHQTPDYDPYIYVWNPLVGTYKILRGGSPVSIYMSMDIEWKALAFGYLPEVNNYVVVHALKLATDVPHTSNTIVIAVHSLNSGSPKKILQHDFDVHWVSDQSVFVNGNAYWVGEDDAADKFVIRLDTKTEILRLISVPEWFEDQEHYPVMHPFGQSIACFIEDAEFRQLDIWVLKCDRIDDFSWEKKMSVSLSENVWADVLGIRNSGQPILANSNNFISYDLETRESYDFVNSYDRLTPNSHYEEGSKPPFVITPFVETLLGLDEKF